MKESEEEEGANFKSEQHLNALLHFSSGKKEDLYPGNEKYYFLASIFLVMSSLSSRENEEKHLSSCASEIRNVEVYFLVGIEQM